MKKNEVQKLFWLDMEMTGLEPDRHKILETCAVITDLEFQTLSSWQSVIFQSPEDLQLMDDWCTKTHTANGLVAKVPHGISEQALDQELCQLASAHFGKEKVVLCGNSIGQDRKFVEKYLPEFAKLLHYRMLDVSSFKIIFENKFKMKYKKKNKHLAMDDVLESIEELKFYLGHMKI